jgi:hypothetical protein
VVLERKDHGKTTEYGIILVVSVISEEIQGNNASTKQKEEE